MLNKKQRAHDIAVSILPDVLKEINQKYYETSSDSKMFFNAVEITEEYYAIYEALLNQLPDD